MLSQTRPNHAKHSHIVLIVFFSDYEIVKLQNLKAQVELLQSLNIDQEKKERTVGSGFIPGSTTTVLTP